MLSNNTIAVIGGTGKSGQFLVRELSRQNIPFRLLVRNSQLRNPSNIPGQHIIPRDVRNPQSVLQLLEGCTAVISTLGQPKGEPSIFSQATRNILAAMQTLNVRRYIVTTGLNVDTPLDKKGPVTLVGTNWMKEHYPETTADKQREYELLAASDLDWTLVRLPLIGLTEASEAVTTSLEDCPGTGIHGTDLAAWLIRQLDAKDHLRQAPFLANIAIFNNQNQ